MDENISAIYHHVKDDYNLSSKPFPSAMWIQRSTWEIVTKTLAITPIVIIGVFGNVIFCIVICKSRSMKTPTNLIGMNMAITDIITLITSPWMFLVRDSFQNYVLGAVGCKIEGFCEFSFLLIGVFNLVIISYNRLMAIVSPYEVHLTTRWARLLIATAWLFGFLVACPLIIYRNYKERQWKNFVEKYCEEDNNVLPRYWFVIVSLMIWIPLGVMVTCYSIIFYKLHKYQKEISTRENPIKINYKKKVARTLFIIVIVFVICRIPFTVFIIWRSKILLQQKKLAADKSLVIFWFVSNYLMFANAMLNPIIYSLTNENFRKAFKTAPIITCLMTTMKPDSTENQTSRKKLWSIKPKKSPESTIKFKECSKTKRLKKLVTSFKSRKVPECDAKYYRNSTIHM